jgi:hypothetical protein
LTKKAVLLLSAAALLAVGAAALWQFVLHKPPSAPDAGSSAPALPVIDSGGIRLKFRAAGASFYAARGEAWEPVYLKGVNMGLTEATTDLNNPNVSYETYREWLALIGGMHANTVRVFTVMPPQFYTALADHNAAAEEPLYLIQGIWFNENDMVECDNAFAEEGRIVEDFKRAARETVDVLHGNSDYTDYGEIQNAVYAHDVSPYVAGYILGLEWEPGFVERTNAQLSHAAYAGRYLTTAETAAPFESFLCEVGDFLIAYETEAYAAQTPVAFLNWATTDTLTHTNEPFEEEDRVSVNTEAILPTAQYYGGLFAAVDVYPYYPEFMNHQPEYLEPGETGEANPYRAYLAELRTQYSVPVLVAEFGVPSSRGMAHKSVMGFHQGGLTEEEQGEAIVRMMEAIAQEGYAGSLIFSWQDEWFKQTWNTVRYAPDDAAARTPNVQSAEQGYGLLAMEPGEETLCLVDGLTEDWRGVEPVTQRGGNTLSVQWDEAYLYLKIDTAGFDFGRDALLIPIRITGRGSAFAQGYDATFSEAADFLLVIDGEEETRLLTDAYEDLFAYTYAYEKGVFPWDSRFKTPGSGLFNPIRQFISNEIVLPLTGEVIPPQYVESGKLTYGITDPDSPQYCSLADFYRSGGVIEVRLPWYLLNVMNSTLGVCLGDFYTEGGAEPAAMPGLGIGIGFPGEEGIPLADAGYFTKERSSYHTRLKKSYAIVQAAMETLREDGSVYGGTPIFY